MQSSPPFICRHTLIFTDEETASERQGDLPTAPPLPPPLGHNSLLNIAFCPPLMWETCLPCSSDPACSPEGTQPQGPRGAVERLDEAVGDPGSGQLLCDAGQGAAPLWVPVLLAQQGRTHQNPGTLPGPRRLVSFLRHGSLTRQGQAEHLVPGNRLRPSQVCISEPLGMSWATPS